MKFPWVKWFPREWLSEVSASKASLEARGLWREALDVMISNDTYMLEAASRSDLAIMLRCRVDELTRALTSLQASGLGDVKLESNGAVTLMSRRLEREFSARKNGRDRVSEFRKKRRCNDPCNGHVPSVSVSGSDSSSEGKGGVGERGVELPARFPSTVDDAILQSGIVGADAPFVTTLWNSAMARNGMDGAGQPIRSWSHYVAKHWPKEQASRLEKARTSIAARQDKKPIPASRLLDRDEQAELKEWRKKEGL